LSEHRRWNADKKSGINLLIPAAITPDDGYMNRDDVGLVDP
jgi:hypothetical protein